MLSSPTASKVPASFTRLFFVAVAKVIVTSNFLTKLYELTIRLIPSMLEHWRKMHGETKKLRRGT
jgi:hypothetical protein